MLQFEARVPAGVRADARLIVLMHGRGSNRHDLFSLAEHMPADAIVVAPEAPFPAAPWGYGPGSAWYQFLGRNRPEPESFTTSLNAIEEFLREYQQQQKFGKVIMGGFSQGGTLALAYGLTHQDEVSAVLNFSGFLADHPDVSRPIPPPPHHPTAIFWGHGRQDPAIPFALAVEGRKQLIDAGYQVEAHDYEIGHWIDGVELRAAIDFIDLVAPRVED